MNNATPKDASDEFPTRTLAVELEYEGTRFCGWAAQSGVRTVQATLEGAIERMVGERVPAWCASRTDAGVHARGQVAAFSTRKMTIPLVGFERGLNALLPKDIAVRSVREVEKGWNPRFASRGKRYRYLIWNDRLPTAMDRARAWWVHARLDVERMAEASALFLGTHDFDAFRSSDCSAAHAIRTIYEASVAKGERSFVAFEVVGNAFCRNMVRIMVGTLVEIGRSRREVASVTEALASHQRIHAGATAPPHGLCLEEVIFDDRLPPRPNARGER